MARIAEDHSFWSEVAQSISQATGNPFSIRNIHRCGGGSINATYCVEGVDTRFFVKVNHQNNLSMFAAEAEGLLALKKTQTIRLPTPLTWQQGDNCCWLVMEYIKFGSASPVGEGTLGRQLAQLHRCREETFGWHQENTIGSTPQINTPSNNWIDFFAEQRLAFQLTLTAERSFSRSLQQKGEQLRDKLPLFFTNYTPIPSLLHGDLWSGNTAFDHKGNPVIFDPATYHGDREADIAMTELFGGFSSRFYAAYHEAWPLDAGYQQRKMLYNLYHILNHANLFGGGYASQAESMMDQLLRVCRI